MIVVPAFFPEFWPDLAIIVRKSGDGVSKEFSIPPVYHRALRVEQDLQRTCIRLGFPHTGHLHNDWTSFRAFPAICLCLLLECEVFFLGTALSSPSHISSHDGRDGRFSDIAGMAKDSLGKSGIGRCRMWNEASLDAVEESRGMTATALAGNIVLAIFETARGGPQGSRGRSPAP